MSGFEESYLYTLNNSKNSFLINYYGSMAIDVPSVPDDVYVIGDTDIDSIKKVMDIIFEHSQIQHTAMSNSEWKLKEVLSEILVKSHKVPMKTVLSQIEGAIFKAPAIVLEDL